MANKNRVGKSDEKGSGKKKPFFPLDHIKNWSYNDTWRMREGDKTRSLSEGKKAIVTEAIARHNERLGNRPIVSGREKGITRLQEKLQEKRYQAVAQILMKRYRVSSSRWAGGKNEIKVLVGETPAARGYSTKAWSANEKWSGTNGHLSVTIQVTWLTEIASVPGLADAEGLLTTHAHQVAPDLWQAHWINQGRGFELKVASGYILLVDGIYYHGVSEAQVRRKHEHALAILRENEIRDCRDIMNICVQDGKPVPLEIFSKFPELSQEMAEMIRNKRHQDLEAAVAVNNPIDLNSLSEFPDLLERYHQQQQNMVAKCLERGEVVSMEELAQYPALLLQYGG
jgi:hypothetical protein